MAYEILIRDGKDSLLLLEKMKTRYGIEHISLFAKSDISLAVTLQIDNLLEKVGCPLGDLHYSTQRLWHWELHANTQGISSVWLKTCTWNEEMEMDDLDRAEKHLQAFINDDEQQDEE